MKWVSEVPSTDGKETHIVRLEVLNGSFFPEQSTCTCKWGSFYRYSGDKIKTPCKHMRKAFKEYRKECIKEINKIKETIK